MLGADRQLAHAHAGRLEDRVDYRRADAGRAELANPARFECAGVQVDFVDEPTATSVSAGRTAGATTAPPGECRARPPSDLGTGLELPAAVGSGADRDADVRLVDHAGASLMPSPTIATRLASWETDAFALGSGGTGFVVENTRFVVTVRHADEALDKVERHRHELHGAFGNDAFGRLAEKAARFFGTPQYIVGQTVAVAAWVLLNSTQLHLGFAWDVYPFIALNLLFSLQAAYAAPLILLAQTRQADRDKMQAERVEKSHSRLEHAAKVETDKILELLQANTDLTQQDKELTEQVADLTKQIHALLTSKNIG